MTAPLGYRKSVAGVHYYFLHVSVGGTELRFEQLPADLRCIKVWIDEGWEYCYPPSHAYHSGTAYGWNVRRPPGKGWELFDDRPDKYSAWRRRRG